MAGEADTTTIEIRTRDGRKAHVYAAVWNAGAVYLAPCKANGAEIRKGLDCYTRIARADVVWTSQDGELSGEQVEQVEQEATAAPIAEVPAPEPVEIQPERVAASEPEPAIEAEPIAAIEPEPAGDPLAELLARVEALEARLASLPVESTGKAVEPEPEAIDTPPSGEVARPKRTPAHERAIRRAWAERHNARLQRDIAADHARMREQVQDALRTETARAEHIEVNWQARMNAAKADWSRAVDEWTIEATAQERKRLATARRARRMIAGARAKAEGQRQRAAVLEAELARLKADMADPRQPERASDIARLVQERDEARVAAAAVAQRNATLQAALESLGDRFEQMAGRLAVAEAAARKVA